MLQSHENDIFSTTQDNDFCHIAMQLFRTTGHTFNTEAVISNKKIRDFVFIDIQHNQVLTPIDWNYLNRVASASLLFSNGVKYFDTSSSDIEIDYYAISIDASNNERSQLAHDIHKILSRISKAILSVILFEVNEFYMFSFAERKQNQQVAVMLSDWFSLNSVLETDILLHVNAAYFSSTSAIDFFYDFEYSIARPYYRYPVSYEYAVYEMFPLKLLDGIEGEVIDRDTIKEIVQKNYLSPLNTYCDDYVEEDSNISNEKSFSTEDFALELLELEMDSTEPNDKSPFSDDESIDDDEFDLEGEDGYEKLDDDYFDELDEELFDDPIKMLKWIEKYVREQ